MTLNDDNDERNKGYHELLFPRLSGASTEQRGQQRYSIIETLQKGHIYRARSIKSNINNNESESDASTNVVLWKRYHEQCPKAIEKLKQEYQMALEILPSALSPSCSAYCQSIFEGSHVIRYLDIAVRKTDRLMSSSVTMGQIHSSSSMSPVKEVCYQSIAEKYSKGIQQPKDEDDSLVPDRSSLMMHQSPSFTIDYSRAGDISKWDKDRHVLMVCEDCGDYLMNYIPIHGFSPEEFLNISMQLALGLSELHNHRLLHMDLRPDNCAINWETGRVKIVNLQSIRRIGTCNQGVQIHSEHSLAYISPEATGRIAKHIDYTSDLYSLGVTLYQLLTGILPFDATDTIELIHSHIAREPVSPFDIRSRANKPIPRILSDIVMKLLKKNQEERYQSCAGLLHDLRKCWRRKSNIQTFTLGRSDDTNQLIIPSKLYDRDEQISSLVDIFNRIGHNTKPEVTIITGLGGVGKSCLVFEAIKRLDSSCLLLSGKFDQVNQGMAYSAITDALHMLVKQVFSWSSTKLQEWTKKLISTLGNDIGLILSLLPELRAVIPSDRTSYPKEAGAEEAKSIDTVVTLFLESFDLPYILFLDDMQWADDDSLRFLQSMLKNQSLKQYILVMAYRDDEIDDEHRLTKTIQAIRRVNICINQISLKSLPFEQVHMFIADCFRNNDLSQTEELARVVFQRSGGNPLFCRMQVQEFYDDGVIYKSNSSWKYSKLKMLRSQLNEGILDLMISRLKKFSHEELSILHTASCLGCRFPLNLLEDVAGIKKESLDQILSSLISAGLISTEDNIFAFAHDRVLEAIYSHIPDEERQMTHYQIGQRLLKDNLSLFEGDMDDSEMLLGIVSHFNKGRSVILKIKEDEPRRMKLRRLCEYNQKAVANLKQKFAYSTAIPCVCAAISCLFDMEVSEDLNDVWQKNHNILFQLYLELGTLQFLANQCESIDETIRILDSRADSRIEKVRAASIAVRHATYSNNLSYSIMRGRSVLQLFGIYFPESSYDCDQFVIEKLKAIRSTLRGYINMRRGELALCDSLLTHLPRMVNEELMELSAVLLSLSVASLLLSDAQLHICFLVQAAEIIFQYGYTGELVTCLVFLAAALSTRTELQHFITRNEIFELVKFALEVCERDQLKDKFKVFQLFGTNIGHCYIPIVQCKKYVENAFRLSKQVGERLQSGFSASTLPAMMLHAGDSLPLVLNTSHKMYEFCRNATNPLPTTSSIYVLQQSLSILIPYEEIWPESTNDQEQMRQNFSLMPQTSIMHVQQQVYTTMFQLIVDRKNNLDRILDSMKQTDNDAFRIRPYYIFSIRVFISCLSQIQDLERTEDVSLRNNKKCSIEEKMKYLCELSDQCPENFKNKYLLLCAELARVEGKRNLKTINYYDMSIELAEKSSFIWECALANELAAHFWFQTNKSNIGAVYLKKAYNLYAYWGAKKKLNRMSIEFPELFTSPFKHSSTNASDVTTFNQKYDLSSVIRSSQFISSSVDIRVLLYNTMKILIEVSGAQKGACILENKVEAEYDPNNTLIGKNCIETLQGIQISDWRNGCRSIIEYVTRSREPIVIDNVSEDSIFSHIPYVRENKCKSIICMPILRQNDLKAILYLENNLITNAFNVERMKVINILATQMAISLENAMHFKAHVSAAHIAAEMQRKRAIEAENFQLKQEEYTNHICEQLRYPLSRVVKYMERLQTIVTSITNDIKIGGDAWTEPLNTINEGIEAINICTQHQQVIINDVLTLSKLEAHQISLTTGPFKATTLINSSLKMFEASVAQKNLKLKVQLPSTTLTLFNDSIMISQVLINILSNAVKFCKIGGTITLVSSIEQLSQEGQCELKISVEDTGIGMSEEEVLHVFDRFSQSSVRTWTEYGGSGLAMFISKNLCELMGGQISAESVKDQWTRFIFSVTCATEPPKET